MARPTFQVTQKLSEKVKMLASVGVRQEEIAKVLDITPKTLRKHFRRELDTGAIEANAEVALANKAELVDALNTNQKTRAQVLREIVELQSVTDKFFIRAFVAMQYFGYLRRDPDTIGYDNWITTLTADPSNFRHMIFGFLFSDEYRGRFGP